MTYREQLKRLERDLLINLLLQSGGNVCKAAEKSNIHRNTFGRKMSEVGLTVREVRDMVRRRKRRDVHNVINSRPTTS